MFADFQYSGLVLCYGPLALIIVGFIASAFLSDKHARRTYLRKRGESGTAVQKEVVAQTPAGMVVKLTPADKGAAKQDA
jgi:hypothetical protein